MLNFKTYIPSDSKIINIMGSKKQISLYNWKSIYEKSVFGSWLRTVYILNVAIVEVCYTDACTNIRHFYWKSHMILYVGYSVSYVPAHIVSISKTSKTSNFNTKHFKTFPFLRPKSSFLHIKYCKLYLLFIMYVWRCW